MLNQVVYLLKQIGNHKVLAPLEQQLDRAAEVARQDGIQRFLSFQEPKHSVEQAML